MSQQPGREEWGWSTEKICPQHVERLAVVYVRQSTMQQVLEHQESTRLQYGLVRRAVAWGWSEARVLVIDDDLGRSGTRAEGRHGFQRLVAEVGLDHVSGSCSVWRCRGWRAPRKLGINSWRSVRSWGR
jgi:hypothetical protein